MSVLIGYPVPHSYRRMPALRAAGRAVSRRSPPGQIRHRRDRPLGQSICPFSSPARCTTCRAVGLYRPNGRQALAQPPDGSGVAATGFLPRNHGCLRRLPDAAPNASYAGLPSYAGHTVNRSWPAPPARSTLPLPAFLAGNHVGLHRLPGAAPLAACQASGLRRRFHQQVSACPTRACGIAANGLAALQSCRS